MADAADVDIKIESRTMYAKIVKATKWTSILLVVVALVLLSIRIYDSQRGPPLAAWHTHVPQELSVAQLDASDWNGYLDHERKIFEDLRTAVTQRLGADERLR